MHVSVDARKCIASGQCAFAAPTVFDHRDDDGVVVLINADPPESDFEGVREAALTCPAEAISISK